eukprot:1191950-Prorocentrum_minimum.AAC.2
MVKVPSPSWHALVESHNLIALREALGHQRHQLEDVKVKLSHSIVVELERFLNVTAVKEEIMHDMELVGELMQRLQKHLAPEGPAPRWPFFTFLAGAMACLLFSAVSHTLHCVSPSLSAFIWCSALSPSCGPLHQSSPQPVCSYSINEATTKIA